MASTPIQHNHATRASTALYPFGRDPPRPSAYLDPSLQSSDNITTMSSSGSLNFHKLYVNCKLDGRKNRFTYVNIIASFWPSIAVWLWFPTELRPFGLPENPLDWSGELLKWIAVLAQMTKGDLEHAHRFLKKVALERCGCEDAKLGFADVWAAYEMCVAENGAKAAMGQQTAQNATPPAMLSQELLVNDEAVDVDERPGPSDMAMIGAPTEEELPTRVLRNGPVRFSRYRAVADEWEVWADRRGNRRTRLIGSGVVQNYTMQEGIAHRKLM